MPRPGHVPALGLLVTLALAACSGDPDAASNPDASGVSAGAPDDAAIVLIGAAGDTVRLDREPQRIVALIPGVNRILVDLGVEDRIVGRTDYDTLSVLTGLPSVGGGIGPDLEVLLGLRPDLVVRFEGAQDARTRERLTDLGIPHIGVRPDGIDDLRSITRTMGHAVGRDVEADRMVRGIDDGLAEVRAAVAGFEHPRVAWILGGTPPLVAGPGTFLQELIDVTGGRNAFDDLDDLYATVSLETLVAREIDVIVIGEGDDPDPRIVEGRRVVRVPSHVEIPGPDIVASAWTVAAAIHPGLVPPFEGGAP